MDDFDDFIDEIRKKFKLDSDIFDVDFLFIPESKNNLGLKPENKDIKGFKVSYHFESGMKKPEIRIEGNIDEKRIRELLRGIDISKYPNLERVLPSKSLEEIDANNLSLEFYEEDEDLYSLEPNIEINDYDKYTEIIFEIPGMNRENVIVELSKDGHKLMFNAENSNRKFKKDIQLPFGSSLKNIELEVKNGLAIINVKRIDE